MRKKEKPILFSTPMVQANLSGRKTMTRRTRGLETINKNPSDWTFIEFVKTWENDRPHVIFKAFEDTWSKVYPQFCIGDVLWVRESFFDTRPYCESPLFYASPTFLYRADESFIGDHKWKPSIHMPKTAARLFLEITDIRVERLQEISDNDAISEGIEEAIDALTGEKSYLYYPPKNSRKAIYIGPCEISGTYLSQDSAFFNDRPAYYSFMSLWESINGDKSWEFNPWVFIYCYKQINNPGFPF